MPDFNQATPPADVTNPGGPAGGEYPKHLHRFVPLDANGQPTADATVIVAWRGKQPIHNEFVLVDGPAAEAEAVAKGYSLTPVLDAPKAAKK